jgi:hypothetical protein
MNLNPNKVTGEGSVAEVVARQRSWSCRQGDCIEFLDGLRTEKDEPAVQLVIGSPQYANKGGRYEQNAIDKEPVRRRDIVDWVDWMLQVTIAARKACEGDVIWIVNGPLENGHYGPAVEGLLWRYYTEFGPPLNDEQRLPGKLDRPVIWSKNAPPNRPDYFGNDWEYCICFPAYGKRRVWNWEAIGTPPKFDNGGAFRQRGSDGVRREGGSYPKNEITRPRDILRATVGGGHMGHDAAHDNEAPFPLKLIEPFIQALTNPGDIVCDPFCGSGTTVHASIANGRGFVGCDLRESQVRLTRERMGSVPGW